MSVCIGKVLLYSSTCFAACCFTIAIVILAANESLKCINFVFNEPPLFNKSSIYNFHINFSNINKHEKL